MSHATHLLVGNPTAQSGRNEARIALARNELSLAGITSELLPTLPGGATIAAVAGALDRGAHTTVIAMGGDGTFREVAAGLLASARREGVALAMLPTGTANDQGRSFGLEARPDALARNVAVIAAGHETRLDAGHIEVLGDGGVVLTKTTFFDSAGWGISARILKSRNEDRAFVEKLGPVKELYRDHMVYAGALLKVFLESYVVSDKFTAHVVADGAVYELPGLTDLIVKGTRIYGGAWVFDKTSAHDDGAFEVIPFQGKRDWTSKAIVDLDGNPLTEDVLNAVGIRHSKPFRGAQIEIRITPDDASGAPLAGQIDGEELRTTSHVRIAVEKKALRLVIPAPTAP